MSLGDITTFSGQDIEVYAFRNLSTLDEAFSRRSKAIQDERKEIQRNQKRVDQDIASANSVNSSDTSLAPLISILSPTTDQYGASQNQSNLQSNRFDTKKLYGQSEANQQRLTELSAEESKIQSASLIKLGQLHTLSYSSFRETNAVRTLGRVQAKNYTKGPRTIAGTMVFSLMSEHDLMKLATMKEDGANPREVLLDQLGKFNVMLLFTNEFGSMSVMFLFNVIIQSEGQNMSVDQIITQASLNYLATDIVPITSIGKGFDSYQQMLGAAAKVGADQTKTESEKNSYRATQRLEGLANSKISEELTSDISDMLAQSRSLF